MDFFKEALGTIKTSGTIRPSSKYLINNCLKDIDFSKVNAIVEFGSGDGCFTSEITARLNPDAKLLSFEINPKFFEYCTQKFSVKENVHILNRSAFDLKEVLREYGIEKVDYIISSLPLALFKEDDIIKLLGTARDNLKCEGQFVQFQYSIKNRKQLKSVFETVKVDFTLMNLPPAFVYKCS